MKQIRFLILFLCLISTTVQGQDFHAGLRIGLCASQVSGDQLSGFDKAGIIAGAFVNRKISSKISLQMEMVFIQKGSRRPVSETDNSYYRMRLHYIEVPVLVQYHFSRKLGLLGGLSGGALIFSEENDQLGEILYAPPFNKFELSFHMGMRFRMSDHWTGDLRYSTSITPVRDYQGSYNYNYFDQGQYNETLQLGMEYTF